MVYEVYYYTNAKGNSPLKKWLAGLSHKDRDRVYSRIMRISDGNFGDHKQITAELYELRLFFGGGFRIYYTILDSTIVVLLSGGGKSNQKRDIARAVELLNDYKTERE